MMMSHFEMENEDSTVEEADDTFDYELVCPFCEEGGWTDVDITEDATLYHCKLCGESWTVG